MSGSQFGHSVALIGDTNGDGKSEYAVGAPSDNNETSSTGSVTVYSGATGLMLQKFFGNNTGDQLGAAIAAAGDVNKDGTPDILVGAPAMNSGDGKALLFSGSAPWNMMRTGTYGAMSASGTSVAPAGDYDGDGTEDFIFGAPLLSSDYSTQGAAQVVSGATGGSLTHFYGPGTGLEAGRTVAPLGDIDGNGTPEVAISSEHATVSGAGVVRIYSGFDGVPLYTLEGDYENCFFGTSIASIGDIDDDDVPDFVVGAPGDTDAAGYVVAYSGATATEIWRVLGQMGHDFGRSVAPAGDLNGDGIPDVIIGAPRIAMPGIGYVDIRSGVDGALIGSFLGQTAGDHYGFSVTGNHDINGDGIPDIIVGAPAATIGGQAQTGYIELIMFDGCPDDPDKQAPGICGCGVPDVDLNMDGMVDCVDQCPEDVTKSEPGVCGCGTPDTDIDDDDIADCHDGCPFDPLKVAPESCGCGIKDLDADGDDVPDCLDSCPNDPDKVEPGRCGCGVVDRDSDGDETYDCHDSCPTDPDKTEPKVCGCGIPDTDSDGDLTPDCLDLCPLDANKITPGTCGCGIADDDFTTDTDRDGAPDCLEECPNDPEKQSPGICGCGNPDVDSDGDGIIDCQESCPKDPLKTEPGICGCGTPDDEQSLDTDGDGIPDCFETCDFDETKLDEGACGCDRPDDAEDTDGDGIINCLDECPTDPKNPRCGCFQTDDACSGGPIFTATTQIVAGPDTVVSFKRRGKKYGIVRIVAKKFSKALLESNSALLSLLFTVDELQRIKAAISRDRNLSMLYQMTVTKVTPSRTKGSSATRARRRKVRDKRRRPNALRVAGLKPGEYEARYRVVVQQRKKVIAASNESPPTRFTIRRPK